MNTQTPRSGRPELKWIFALMIIVLVMAFVTSMVISPAQAAGKPPTKTPAPTTISPTATPGGASWSLTWSDEFDGAAGTGVDTNKWLYDLGHGYGCAGCPNNWGTGEIAEMTNSTDNVYHDGAGNLAIKPIRSGSAGFYTWTSGRIETQRTDFEAAPGGMLAFESRIALPNVTGRAAQGYWPAFWSLGAPFRGNYLNWPSVGEIDMMENINGQNTVYQTLHCGYSPGGPCNETTGIGNGGVSGWSPALQGNFHVYRMEFDKSTTPNEIRWYVDGIQTWRVTADAVDPTTWANATDHGFFIILNVAIGGGWPGNPTSQTASGIPMYVDYVRVYNR